MVGVGGIVYRYIWRHSSPNFFNLCKCDNDFRIQDMTNSRTIFFLDWDSLMLNKYHRTCNTVIKNAQIFNSSCSLEKCIYHLYIAPTRQEFLHILSHVRIEFTPVQRIHSTPSPPKFCFFICSHSHPINKMTLFTIFHYPGR